MNLKKAQIIGFVFTVLFGTLLHFTYEWSGYNPYFGLFSAVNESTWEHLKLLYVPMLFFGVVEYLTYGKHIKNFIQIRFLSILLGMAIIIVGFYTYTGITGNHYLIIDILLFIAAVFFAYYFSYKLLQTDKFSSRIYKWLAIIGILLLIYFSITFTYSPPHIPLFFDTESGIYGLKGT